MASALASAYHGPPELTPARIFTEWTFDPAAVAVIVLLGVGYLFLAHRAGDWPLSRRVWFVGLGLGFLVIATMSSVGVYMPILMYVKAVQVVVLALLAPLFLAMGRPVTLIGAAFPRAGRRLEAVIRSRPAKVALFPAITTLALVLVPFVMFFTSWLTAQFHSATIRELTYLALLAPGYVFFWTLLRVDPVPKEYPYGVTLWITATEVIGDMFVGLSLIADQNLVGAAYYHALAWPWGPSLATDQVFAGGVIWVLGDLVGLPFLAAQLVQMMREDKAEADQIDAELDAQEAARAAQAGAVAADPAAPAVDKPWWERDERFTGRFKSI
jgi:cytochrome c oxidase assembly factor CtaG